MGSAWPKSGKSIANESNCASGRLEINHHKVVKVLRVLRAPTFNDATNHDSDTAKPSSHWLFEITRKA